MGYSKRIVPKSENTKAKKNLSWQQFKQQAGKYLTETYGIPANNWDYSRTREDYDNGDCTPEQSIDGDCYKNEISPLTCIYNDQVKTILNTRIVSDDPKVKAAITLIKTLLK